MSLHQSGKNERYNLVVIGAGAAGLTVAAGAAGLGARVALVERGAMGGDCLNYGCVPSKALLAAAAAAHQTRRFLAAAGVPAPSALHRDAQWSRATAQVRAAIAAIAPHDSEARFRSLGVEVFAGHGRWVGGKAGGPHVEVISEGGASRILHTRSVVLATGSRPLIPPIPGLTEAGFLTNETLFDLPQLPARIAVLGGGPVGVELAQALTRLGAQVHLVEKMPWLLPREDPDATAVLADALCAEGVILHLGKTVVRVAGDGAERRLELEPAAGLAPGESREVLKVDQVLVAVGRQPNSEGLGLECAADRGDSAAGGFIPVDTRMRTRHRGVFACGDVAGPHLFTHTANHQARVVIQNALFPFKTAYGEPLPPWCLFTDPELARVGLNEREARAHGRPYRTVTIPMAAMDRAVCEGNTTGFLKVLTPPRGDDILGATLVGAHAGELIHLIALALHSGLKLRDLSQMMHVYPTRSEVMRRAGDENRKLGFTPLLRAWVERYLRWRRG